MRRQLLAEALQIAECLSQYESEAGIIDPDEGRPLAHTYMTDFYAWLCAELFACGHGIEWRKRAERAVDIAIAVMAEQAARAVPIGSKPDFHWEFKHLALLNVVRLLGHQLPPQTYKRLNQVLLTGTNLNIPSANWTAMRAVAYAMRFQLSGRLRDRARGALELECVLSLQTAEGFFPDMPYSYSFQYHAYTVSLLGLYHRLTSDRRVKDALLRGVRLIADFVNPAGDFNYYGRGQRQLFGYASLILALGEASAICADPAEASRYRRLQQRILRFVLAHRRPDGLPPLVVGSDNQEHWGWYDYNHLGDYASFWGVWLLLAAERADDGEITVNDGKQESYTRLYEEMGLAVIARPGLFAVFSASGRDLSEPVGLVHLWPGGPLCLGGPEPSRAMGRDYSWNYLGPLVDSRPVLQNCHGTLSVDRTTVRLQFLCPRITVVQTYDMSCVEGHLRLEQQLIPRDREVVTNPLAIPSESQPSCSEPLQPGGPYLSPLGTIQQWIADAVSLPVPQAVTLDLVCAITRVGMDPTPEAFSERSSPWHLAKRRILHALWFTWVVVTGWLVVRRSIAGNGGDTSDRSDLVIPRTNASHDAR